MTGPIEEFLVDVSRGIGDVDALVLREALTEMRGHLEESAAGFEELGEDREAAERLAVEAFGRRSEAVNAIPAKQQRLIDFRLWPVSIWWIGAALSFSVFVWPYEWIPVWAGPLMLLIILSMCARGFLSRRFEILQGVMTFSVVTFFAILATSQFMTFNSGGDIVSRSSAVQDRANLLADAKRLHGERTYEVTLMEDFQAGMGKTTLENTQWAESKGYLLPHENGPWVVGEKAYTRDLDEAVRKWKAASANVDLRVRQRSIDLALKSQLRSMENTQHPDYWNLVATRIRQLSNTFLDVLLFTLFLNGLGAIVRVTLDALLKLFRPRWKKRN